MPSILLVDDDITSEALKEALLSFGFCLETARSLNAALRLTRKKRFDAILLEYSFRTEDGGPRTGSGIRFLRWLRRSQANVPVIMYSAVAGEPYESTAVQAGADAYIPKTAGMIPLLDQLRRIPSSSRPHSRITLSSAAIPPHSFKAT
jgi:DNA-binding response OmpR family regulator